MTSETDRLPWEDDQTTPTPAAVVAPWPIPYTGTDFGADPAKITEEAALVRDELVAAVRARNKARRRERVERLGGDDPRTETDVRREVVGGVFDHDALAAYADAFTTAAREAKTLAGDVLDELPGRAGAPRKSLKVADGQGFYLTLGRTQPTDLSVDRAEVVEVVVAAVISRTGATGADVSRVAEGARSALEVFGLLLSSSGSVFKGSALDELVRVLEDRGDDVTATRLRAAYGRRDRGEPAVTITRKPIPARDVSVFDTATGVTTP